MALYKNTAKVRKFIGVRRIKRWVAPNETVDLDATDVRLLGGNAGCMRLANKKIASKKKAKTVTSDVSEKRQEAIDKKDLKESLEGMTKERIIEVAETVVGIDVLWKTKKADLVKQVLKASKDKGYRYVLKKS